MSGRPTNPSKILPDEAAMLSFVEGEMSAAEEAALRRGLSHAPQIVARLESMRRDKALLRASMLREALRPRSLSARVDEQIAREAVLGSGGAGVRSRAGTAQQDEVVVRSTLETRVVGEGWRKARLGLAMAAGLALAAGGAFLAIDRMGGGSGGGGGGGGRNLALATDRAVGGADVGVEGGASRGEVDAGSRVANASGNAGDGAGSLDPSVIPGASGADVIEVATGDPAGDVGDGSLQERLASAPFDGTLFDLSTDLTGEAPEPELISTRLLPGTVARRDLMALAEQHRLALRVSADEPREVIEALEAAVAAAPAGWRVVRESPVMLAGAIGVTISPFDETMTGGPASAEGEDADRDADGDGPGRIARDGEAGGLDDAWLLRGTDDAMAVYLTEVDITLEALAELDRDLTRRGGSRAGFAALESPIDRVLNRNLLLVPASDVIWWYHPPREWSRRTLVPVVVERR